MDFLNNIPINTTGGFIGLALLVIGGFMVLAGVGIISIQQVTVRQGRATWVVGLLLAVGGVFLLYPEFSAPAAPESPAATEAPGPGTEAPAAPTAASAAGGELSDWRTIEFTVPGNGLWLAVEGSYSATGTTDTIAWSEEVFSGDLELSFDIESPDSYAAGTIILYGNGGSFAPGNLLFVLASDLQAIQADTIYEGGRYLYSSLDNLPYAGQKHTALISVHDRKASLFIDGVEVATARLGGNINGSGRIGLFKWGGIQNITFSNLFVRSSGTVE